MHTPVTTPRPFEKTLYIASQVFTRGGDWLISSWLIVVMNWHVLAGMAVGAAFNGLFGFIIQRYLVFERPEVIGRNKTPQKFRTFLVVRVPIGLIAAGSISLLCLATDESWYPVYALVALGILWYITFKPQKDVFTGNVRKLHPAFRKLRVLLLHKLPKWAKRQTLKIPWRYPATK